MAIIINGTTGLSGVDGSAGTPALQGSDSNTGISFGTDEVNINTGGSTRATVDSSGRVGIGTTSPSTRLHIYQTSSSQAGLVETDQSASVLNFKSTGQSFGQPQIGCAASDMILNTNGAERARITATGDFKFNSGYGSVATAYGCRAWVNFNGTGAVAIRASGNVSSITDNGTGAYTVNFATALVDANYAHEAQGSLTLTDGNLNHEAKTHTAATGSVKVRSSNNAATNSAGDLAEIRVIIFR